MPDGSLGIRLLLVDDDADAAAMYEMQLSARGFQVVRAHSGTGAIARASMDAPDLIYFDLGLPEMHGFDVLEQLRAGPNTAGIPVVILTNYSEPSLSSAAASSARTITSSKRTRRRQFSPRPHENGCRERRRGGRGFGGGPGRGARPGSPGAHDAALDAVEPERLLEGEDEHTAYVDDAVHWTEVYAELLDFKRSLLAVAEHELRSMNHDAESEVKETDLKVLIAEAARFERRLDFWRVRAGELKARSVTDSE
jgi:CheY-like chemotaxis protein